MVLSHLKTILRAVYLKILVIFLISGDEKVTVAHFVHLFGGGRLGLDGFASELFLCILSFSQVNMSLGMLLLCAINKICIHLLRCCSLFRGGWAFC